MYFKVHGSRFASVSGPTLFNIFLSVLFLTLNKLNTAIVYNIYYTDDNSLYKACDNVDSVVQTLRMSAEEVFMWFKYD